MGDSLKALSWIYYSKPLNINGVMIFVEDAQTSNPAARQKYHAQASDSACE
jgi:hypothetical protein